MDPLSTAAALTTTANKAAKNSLVQALFLPTAKAYGDHWGAETREKLKQAKAAKAQANLAEHLRAVQPHVPPDFRPDPELAEAWMDGAANVDPVDEDLSAAWRATLLAIGAGNPFRHRMLEVIKALTPDEARAFLVLAGRSKPATPFQTVFGGDGSFHPIALAEYRARLESLGLVRTRWDLMSGPSIRVAIVFFTLMVLGLVAARTVTVMPAFNASLSMRMLDAMTPLILLLMVVAGLLSLVRAMTNLSLTNFGQTLASAVQRLGAAPPAPADEPTPSTSDAAAPSAAAASRQQARKTAAGKGTSQPKAARRRKPATEPAG